MKTIKQLVFILMAVGLLTSCQSVRVATDYDESIDFSQYTSFAFYKPGIDKAEISDLDKRRILRAIDHSLLVKGMTKSEEASLLVSIMTDSAKEMNVYPGYYGYYGPWWGYPNNYVSVRTEGILYIDLIDRATNTLIWQGVGKGIIEPSGSVEAKTKRINNIVERILEKYPPGAKKKKK